MRWSRHVVPERIIRYLNFQRIFNLPVVSNVRPGGQEQVKLPSVFMHVPPPLQIPGCKSHSFTSVQLFPSTFAYPLGQVHSFRLHMLHGLPQAKPTEQQHSDCNVSLGRLFSHRPLTNRVQQDPFLLSKRENVKNLHNSYYYVSFVETLTNQYKSVRYCRALFLEGIHTRMNQSYSNTVRSYRRLSPIKDTHLHHHIRCTPC